MPCSVMEFCQSNYLPFTDTFGYLDRSEKQNSGQTYVICMSHFVTIAYPIISGQLSNKQTKKTGYHLAKYVRLGCLAADTKPPLHHHLISSSHHHSYFHAPSPLWCATIEPHPAIYIVYANTVQIATSTTKPPMSGSNQFILPLYDPLGIQKCIRNGHGITYTLFRSALLCLVHTSTICWRTKRMHGWSKAIEQIGNGESEQWRQCIAVRGVGG